MDRVPHIVRERKKSKTLGEPRVISREAYEALELDSRLELIRALIPIGLSYVQEELEREVINLAGPRYSRKAGEAVTRYRASTEVISGAIWVGANQLSSSYQDEKFISNGLFRLIVHRGLMLRNRGGREKQMQRQELDRRPSKKRP